MSKIPRAVWAATALHIGAMVVFTLLYPAYWAFDESGHVSRVVAAQHGDVAPTPGSAPYVAGVGNSYQFFAVPDQPPFVDYTAPRRDVRPSFGALNGAAPYVVPGGLPNQLAEHPPGYYLLAAGALDLIPDSAHLAWDQTIGLLRLLDVLLMAPLALLCWAVARRFARPQVAVAAAFVPVLIPGLERLGGSVNNDSALIVLTGVFTLLTADVVRGDRRLRIAVALAMCTAAALLVKGFALVLPVVALLAYVIAWRRARQGFPWLPAGVVALGSAIGGLWWLHNLLVYGAVQPAGLTPAQADHVWPRLPAGAGVHLATFVRRTLDVLTTDFWGALGLAAPPSLPGVVTVVASVVAVALLLAPLLAGRRLVGGRLVGRRPAGGLGGDHAPPAPQLLDLGVMALPTVLILIPLLVHAWSDFERTGQPIGIQGRYLYTAIVGLVAVGAAGVEVALDRAPPWVKGVERVAPLATCLAGVALEATAIGVVLVKLWLPRSASLTGEAQRLVRSIGAHSPWPPAITVGLVVACAVAGAVAVAVAASAATGAATGVSAGPASAPDGPLRRAGRKSADAPACQEISYRLEDSSDARYQE